MKGVLSRPDRVLSLGRLVSLRHDPIIAIFAEGLIHGDGRKL
jgi:hypothetical protein